MKVFWTPQSELHAPRSYFADGTLRDCAEVPQRVTRIRDALAAAGMEIVCVDGKPSIDGLGAAIGAVHAGDYLEYLRTSHQRWQREVGAGNVLPDTFPLIRFRPTAGGFGTERPLRSPESVAGQAGYFCFDMAAPIVAGTWQAAMASASCAVLAADTILGGERAAYALCRPPGHHAGRDYCGGFCYLNNAAIAAKRLLHGFRQRNEQNRIAILDVDYHHGNGTQDIFYGRMDVLFVSIHADPAQQYPYFWGHAEERGEGAGSGFNVNFPLARGTSEAAWLATFEDACTQIERFGADALVVSLGVDTYQHDRVGDFQLSPRAFTTIGQRLAMLNLPTAFIQEGGYNLDAVGQCVANTLLGFEQSAS